jgi:hypothetical protein
VLIPTARANSALRGQRHVARLAEEQQRAGQRRGHAGAHDQGRQAAHQEHAGQMAAGQAARCPIEPGGQRRRQPQLIDVEHRQREQRQQQRKCRQHGRLLQGRCEAFAGQPAATPRPV